MGQIYGYLLMFIALILVVVKLVLEQQYETDKVHGVEGNREEYTFRGMLRAIRAERKERRRKNREERRMAAMARKSPSKPSLQIESFKED